MMPLARNLPGDRLHLQHGPSDLIVWAEGGREDAYDAATRRFQTIISEIVEELDALRQMLSPLTQEPKGTVARRMHDACRPYATTGYLTRMAAVAGSVADEVLDAMRAGAEIKRAYVNNGGDISLHLSPGTTFRTAMKAHDGTDLGQIRINGGDSIGGIATSGRHGRSLSLGIADSVTVLANTAAQADVAATLIANSVDLPGHPGITRRAAQDIDDTSDLGDLPVVVRCGRLTHDEVASALNRGLAKAKEFEAKGLISAASLHLANQSMTTDEDRLREHAVCNWQPVGSS